MWQNFTYRHYTLFYSKAAMLIHLSFMPWRVWLDLIEEETGGGPSSLGRHTEFYVSIREHRKVWTAETIYYSFIRWFIWINFPLSFFSVIPLLGLLFCQQIYLLYGDWILGAAFDWAILQSPVLAHILNHYTDKFFILPYVYHHILWVFICIFLLT